MQSHLQARPSCLIHINAHSLMYKVIFYITRMHSSRMRTGRSLTIFQSLLLRRVYLVPGGGTWSGGCTWSQGVPDLGDVPGPGWGGTWSGCTWSQWGVPGPGGCTWSWGCTWSQGVYLVPGVYLVLGGGGYLVWGGVPGPGGCLVWYSPLWTEWMTDRCKNITLAKTSFRPVIIIQ